MIVMHMPMTDMILFLFPEFFIFLADKPVLPIPNLLETLLVIIRLIDFMAVTFAEFTESAATCAIKKGMAEGTVIYPVRATDDGIIVFRCPVNPAIRKISI